MWGIWKRHYFKNNTGIASFLPGFVMTVCLSLRVGMKCRRSNLDSGQAVLELAVFGAFLIMLLGILINYGLRYDSQQEAMQQGFRKALFSAFSSLAAGSEGVPISTAHVVVNDKYIPDPSNASAFGSIIPASSSASAIASYRLDEEADTDAEEDHLIITFNNNPAKTFSYLSDDIKNAEQPGKPGGLQSDYTEIATENTAMVKNENSSSIDTTDNATFSNTIQRQITYDSGGGIATQTVNSTVSQSVNQQWQTSW